MKKILTMTLVFGFSTGAYAAPVLERLQAISPVDARGLQAPAIVAAAVETEGILTDEETVLRHKDEDLHTLVARLMEDNKGACVRVHAFQDAMRQGRIGCERDGDTPAEKLGSDILLHYTAFGLIVAGKEAFFVHRPTMLALSLEAGDLSDPDAVEERLEPALVSARDLKKMLKRVRAELARD
ncbi:MAG: hypothetical protein WC969_11895 [Elusimicrobiota bacterium]|jgi:hypothetical protein